MTNYILDGHDLSSLLDKSKPSISFVEDPRKHVPKCSSIIYSVWNADEEFIYVGISSEKSRGPVGRLLAHRSGARSGDQFCIYIQDFYVISEVVRKGFYEPAKGVLDKLTQEYIRENLFYRFVSFDLEDRKKSDEIVKSLETKIKRGEVGGMRPILNGETVTYDPCPDTED